MRLVKTLCFALAGIALTSAASAQTAPEAPSPRTWTRYDDTTEVQLRDVAAIVRVRPENRTDVAVSISHAGPLRAPRIRATGNRVVIDGNMRRQIRSCRVDGQNFEVVTSRNGRLQNAQLPTIELRVPQSARITASGAVRMHVDPSQSARIRVSGCGDADIERVEDDAEINVAGSQDVRLYEAGSATVAVAGSGDVVLGAVRDGLTASIAGAGDLTAARADGPTNIAIQGSGDVLIRDGRATTLSVAIAGAGDVTHNGSAERLDVVILGAGDVRVRQVDGQVTRRVLGGGEVTVGR